MATNWWWLCLSWFTVATSGQSWPWKAREFSSLLSTVCHNETRVCDPDNLLDPKQLQELTNQLTNDDKNCQEQLAIGVALALQTFHNKRDQSLDPFADELRENWHLSDCHNDLVLFLSNDSLEIGFSLGNTSRTVFGQSFEELARNLNKEFERRTDFYSFISTSCQQILDLFATNLKTTDHWSVIWNVLLTAGYLLVIFVILAIACYYCCYKRTEKRTQDVSVISSEMTTKYSELKPTIEMTERLN